MKKDCSDLADVAKQLRQQVEKLDKSRESPTTKEAKEQLDWIYLHGNGKKYEDSDVLAARIAKLESIVRNAEKKA